MLVLQKYALLKNKAYKDGFTDKYNLFSDIFFFAGCIYAMKKKTSIKYFTRVAIKVKLNENYHCRDLSF